MPTREDGGAFADNAPIMVATIQWKEDNKPCEALWRSESGLPAPARIEVADDTLRADRAFRLASEGMALLWRGDYQNARQLLNALARRIDERAAKTPDEDSGAETLPLDVNIYHRHRMQQAQRARTLGRLLIPLRADFSIPLKRAPDVRAACIEAFVAQDEAPSDSVIALRDLLGLIGAHEWRKKGVEVAALNSRIHPHYGVFAPIRSEYVGLVAKAAWPGEKIPQLAFDIGTGTGVLAAVLARRGVTRVLATDLDARALACARENVERLGVATKVEVATADLFPPGQAELIVCNPPWLPGKPASRLEGAIYDPESRMLRGFLAGLRDHLAPGGEAWLILSDLAEHLGLRTRAWLENEITVHGLTIAGRMDTRPVHPKSMRDAGPLGLARNAETTSLWRLRAG
jgi:hypothetical protein